MRKLENNIIRPLRLRDAMKRQYKWIYIYIKL